MGDIFQVMNHDADGLLRICMRIVYCLRRNQASRLPAREEVGTCSSRCRSPA
jgi:hypothetical protein